MKRLALLSILVCFCFISIDDASARRGHRGHGHRGGVSVGLAVGPYWGWGPSYYPYYHHAPVVIERQAPPVYIEQQSPPAPAANYWYYCQSSNGYYPHVKECPAGWLRVLP